MNSDISATYIDPGIPEYRGNKFIEALPPILDKKKIACSVAEIPPHDASERALPPHLRLHCLHRIFKYFEPLPIHIELEQRFSVLLRQGYLGRNPETIDYVHHLRNGHRRIAEKDLHVADHVVQSTATSFSMIGISGAGKSTSIHNILKLYKQVIEHANPINLTQIVWLKIDCPPDGSKKSLCISFFQKIDQLLGTNYESKYVRPHTSADTLAGYIPMVANLHGLGVLIIDEVQNLSSAKSGGAQTLLNFFVNLVNTIGLPVILIGTMQALSILQGDFRHARRAAGIGSFTFDRLSRGKQWNYLLEALWGFQWTKSETLLTPEIEATLYDETQGITDVLVKLYALTQHRAISSGGKEEITPKLIRQVAKSSLAIIQPMIDALRSNDPRKIQQYADLHVPAFNQLIESSVEINRPSRSVAQSDIDLEAHSQVYAILSAAGIDSESAKFLIREVLREDPDIAPILMAQRALALFNLAPQPSPTPQAAVRKGTSKKSSELILENDLRRIAERSENVYEAILEAGLIKKPTSEFRIIH